MRTGDASCSSLCLSTVALVSVVICSYALWLLIVDISTDRGTKECIGRKIICGFLGLFAIISLLCYTVLSCAMFVQQVINIYRAVSSTHQAQIRIAPSPNTSPQAQENYQARDVEAQGL